MLSFPICFIKLFIFYKDNNFLTGDTFPCESAVNDDYFYYEICNEVEDFTLSPSILGSTRPSPSAMPSQRLVMDSLYTGFGYDTANFPSSECDWVGVDCNDQNKVYLIDLGKNFRL